MPTSTQMEQITQPHANITEEILQKWKWFLAVGAVSMILGLLAIIFPIVASITVSLFLGWILIIVGAAHVVSAFQVKKWRGFLLTLIGGIVAIGIGAAMVLYPASGVAALTLLVVAFLLASGVFRISTALRIRPYDHWGWLLASGVLAIILALLVIIQFPISALWFIGLLVGLDLFFAGVWLIMIAWSAKRMVNA